MTDSVRVGERRQSAPLGLARRGFCGHIHAIHVGDGAHGSDRDGARAASARTRICRGRRGRSPARGPARPRPDRRARQRHHDRAAPPRGDGHPRDLIGTRMTTATETSAWRFALVGTPNSGKTALFNALTGSRQKVANYPGVTVERKAGMLQTASGHRVDLIDLPGTYSLRGRSPDEEITRDVVLGRLASEAAARSAAVRGRRHQPARRAAPRDRAEAGRPAAAARAQHDRHRAPARHRHRSRQAVGRARRAGGDLDRGAARRHRGSAAPHRRDGGERGGQVASKAPGSRRPRPIFAPRSARPTASSRPRSASRRGPTP